MPANAKVMLDLDSSGHGTVTLNGYELPFATAVKVEARVGEATVVHLELIAAEVLIKADGIEPDQVTLDALADIVTAFNEESDLVTARVEQ